LEIADGADILDFDYDAFVREPRPAVERLLAFCGLDWEDDCMSFHRVGNAVKTASVWQVREPLYQRSSGRWRNYAPCPTACATRRPSTERRRERSRQPLPPGYGDVPGTGAGADDGSCFKRGVRRMIPLRRPPDSISVRPDPPTFPPCTR
jgi:hypothetical protein